MSSATAMEKHAGGVAEYRSSEGKHVRVPFRGPVDHTCRDILGGLRSTCTYVGASARRLLLAPLHVMSPAHVPSAPDYRSVA